MPEMRLPNFLVIGTQKGGTTSLDQALRQHERIFLPPCKEIHYFSLHSAEPLAWYANHFGQATPGQICAEVTPYYLFHPAVPERISNCLGQLPLIVLLRDPVERLLSHYFHACRLGNETLGLREALAAEGERLAAADGLLRNAGGVHRAHQQQSYFSRSCYEKQLPRYAAWQQKGNLLVLRSEDLFEQPKITLAKVLEFIGLPAADSNYLKLPQANSGGGEAEAVAEADKKEIKELFTDTYNWTAAELGLNW